MTEFLLAAAGHPWIYAVVVLACLIDGFFPPIPSETLVVGLAALTVPHGWPAVVVLFLAAVVGAFLGDNLAYLMGRRLGTAHFRWMRRPLMRRALATAERELGRRPVSLILVARFLPGVRVAVNLAAGATGFSRRRFVAISTLSASLWAGYCVGIGVVAGSWFRDNPVLGLLLAILLAGVLGLLVDRVVRGVSARRARAAAAEVTGSVVTPPAVVTVADETVVTSAVVVVTPVVAVTPAVLVLPEPADTPDPLPLGAARR